MNDNNIDMVFTDLEMPRMNGLEFTQAIRAWNDKKETPVVMITSRTTGKHRNLAEKAGVDDYLTKPVNRMDFKMTQNTNQASGSEDNESIAIHYIGLDARELAIFDRVVAFNVTHGLAAHKTASIDDAELIVINQNDFSTTESYSNKTIFMQAAVEPASPELIDNSEQQVNVEDIVDNSITTLNTESESQNQIRAEVEAEPEPVTEVAEQSGHHALVIDDSASIRKQLELELRDAGVSSDFAESGEDALEKVKEGQFDLIFLDIIMPGIDGYETCKQMRAMPEYKKTPIIMLSGKTSPLDEVQGVIAGATTYLTKPVKSDKLQETLNRVTKWIDNFSQPKKTETA
ncbi:Protein PilG [Nymphon striatum]|nr:Protein PilG [Nymphon striatum]